MVNSVNLSVYVLYIYIYIFFFFGVVLFIYSLIRIEKKTNNFLHVKKYGSY